MGEGLLYRLCNLFDSMAEMDHAQVDRGLKYPIAFSDLLYPTCHGLIRGETVQCMHAIVCLPGASPFHRFIQSMLDHFLRSLLFVADENE